MEKHVSIQDEFIFMSFEWWVKCKSWLGLSMSWSVWWRKVWVWWDEFWVELKNGEMDVKCSIWNKRDVCTWKIWFEKPTCFKIELNHLLLKKLVCALRPKLLSHSPKENGTNEAYGVEIWGLHTCMGDNYRPKSLKYLL